MTTAEQVDMFPAMPRNTVTQTFREMWNEYRRDSEKYQGLLTASQVALALDVSRARVHELIKKGELRAKCYFNQSMLLVALCDVEERIIAKRDGKLSVGGRPAK